jgi:hypothetical protein
VRFLALGVALVAAGCGSFGAIKAYEGRERSADQLATVRTELRDEVFTVADTQIVAVDGVNYKRPHYEAQMLPGKHWIGIADAISVGRRKREQFCAFELALLPGCTYRPHPPSVGLPDRGLPEVFQVADAMLVDVQCNDLSYAAREPVECSDRPLCRTDSDCLLAGARCVRDPRFGFGACSR